MITKEITSLQHPFIKHLVNLRNDPHYRKEHNSVVIAGRKLLKECSPIKILLREIDSAPFPLHTEETYFVTAAILKKVTGLENPEPVAGVIDMPKTSDLKGMRFLLALDQVSDPGNLGTLLRTALSLGWDGAFLIDGCVDPFNDKAIRAAKGATFRLPLRRGSSEELRALIVSNKMHALVADMKGTSLYAIEKHSPLLLILGNESKGPSSFAKKHFLSVCIPMQGPMESLNVATAGAILMHHLRGAVP
ncbi:MAG: RNA methyltransferase [Chlamydiota bacterium]